MREFNTLGPVNPRQHYHVNRVAVKAAMRAKIQKGRYFTLNAARQTGKTTLFREVMAELIADEGYFGVLISFETLRGYGRRDFYYWLQRTVYESLVGRDDVSPATLAWLETAAMTDHNSFGLVLSRLCQRMGRRGVLIIASIVSKATPHRSTLLPTLLYDERRSDFLDPETQELLMYGVLREVEEEPHLRVANPIYRKLLLRFSPAPHDLQINGAARNRYLHNGALDFDGLLDSFQDFMVEHGVRLLRSETSGRPLEISGQYLLLSYLTAALNTVGGLVTIESLSSAGEIDLLAFHQGQRFIIETKIWYGLAAYERAKAQLAAYVRASRLPSDYLVIFDEQVTGNPLCAEHGAVFETNEGSERLRVYLIGVRVA